MKLLEALLTAAITECRPSHNNRNLDCIWKIMKAYLASLSEEDQLDVNISEIENLFYHANSNRSNPTKEIVEAIMLEIKQSPKMLILKISLAREGQKPLVAMQIFDTILQEFREKGFVDSTEVFKSNNTDVVFNSRCKLKGKRTEILEFINQINSKYKKYNLGLALSD